MSTSRRFMCTIKVTEDRENWTKDWSWAESLPHKYITFQEEKGEETGYRHYQLYIELDKSVRPAAIKKALGKDIHVETARGTGLQCAAYCNKEETRVSGPWTTGLLEAEKKKLSTEDIWAQMREPSRRTTSILEACGYSPLALPQVEKTRKLLRAEDRKFTERKRPIIHVLHGPPQEGKTSYVKRLMKANNIPPWEQFWASKDSRAFWERYEGQKHCIIDECDKNTEAKMPEGVILGMLDDTDMVINVKFGFEPFISEHVWFVGNNPIWDSYLEPLVVESLKKRIADHGEVLHIIKDIRDALPETIWCPPETRRASSSGSSDASPTDD